MIKINSSLTISSNGDIYKCYSLVGITKYKDVNIINDPYILIKDVKPLSSYCTNGECIYNKICLGGCPFHQYAISNHIRNDCHFKLIDSINKYIFGLDLIKYRVIDSSQLMEGLKNVQISVLDIQ